MAVDVMPAADQGINNESLRAAPYRVLSDEELDRIHEASLEILITCGVAVGDKAARSLLADNGARIDSQSAIVRLTPDMVESAIAACPAALTLYRRDSGEPIRISHHAVAFATWGGCVTLLDMRTGKKRPFNAADHRDAAIVVDALPEISVYKTPGYMEGIPQAVQQIHIAETALYHTGKPLYMAAGSNRQLDIIGEMFFAAAGGQTPFRQRPSLVISACLQSPLCMSASTCHVIMTCARRGVPLSITSMVMAGASGPVRLSGTLVVSNAEFLAGLVLHQLSRSGAPVLYGSVTTAMDLRYGNAPLGTPEKALLSSATTQLADRYGVPANLHGGSDSKASDSQSSHEITLTALLPALAGGGLISAAGVLDMGLTNCYHQLVRDCEFLHMIECVKKGIRFDDESLAVNVIKAVGPGGNYLTHENTSRLARSSQSVSGLIDRQCSVSWEHKGAKTMGDRAHDRTIDILNTHCPCGLSGIAASRVSEIAAEGKNEIMA